MGVYFRGRNIGMAEHRLERAEIGAALEQMRRKGMAQDVRADAIGRDARIRSEAFEHLKKPHTAQKRLARRK